MLSRKKNEKFRKRGCFFKRKNKKQIYSVLNEFVIVVINFSTIEEDCCLFLNSFSTLFERKFRFFFKKNKLKITFQLKINQDIL